MENIDAYHHIIRKFIAHDIDTASHLIESMTEQEASTVLKALPPELAIQIVKNLQISFVATLLEKMEDEVLDRILPRLEPQTLTTLLMHVSKDCRERIRGHISGNLEDEIRELLEYPEKSVGRVMTTNFLSFDKKMTARDAISRIRSLSKKRLPASYAYVVDAEKHLLGVINMRDLMIAMPNQILEEIMLKNVFSLDSFIDVQDAAKELSKRKYFAAPVVDSEHRIIGIIKAEKLIKGVQDESTQDIQRMFGVGRDEKPFSSIFFSMKKRLFWLHINLITAFAAAAVVALFEDIIAQLTILAVFLPVVAGQGGNAGAQSLAVVMRGIVMREIPKEKTMALIMKEGGLGAINGVIIGLVTAVVAWMWNGNPYLGLVIGLGMFFNLLFAGFAGASIPISMKKIGIDPAQSSSIILTTVTDILGFLAFLGFAVLFREYLI